MTAAVEKLCSESLKRAVRRFSAHTAKKLSVYLRLGREAAGRLCVLLAKDAEAVVRMVCGIPTIIKGQI